jgi:hypothetical protein
MFTGCNKEPEVVEAIKIRFIQDRAELLQSDYDLKSLLPISAQAGLEFALIQEAEWNPSAKLIGVFQEAAMVNSEAQIVTLLWTYRFRNEAGSSWLGVVYGSNGLVDVMQKDMVDGDLTKWPSIQEVMQKVDWEKVNNQHTALLGIKLNDVLVPVWVDKSQSNYTVIMNAETGIEEDYGFFLDQMRERINFFSNQLVGTAEEKAKQKLKFYAVGSRFITASW